jgi:hypothetical protein
MSHDLLKRLHVSRLVFGLMMILALGVPTHAFASTAPAAGEAHPVARHGWTERGEV